MRRSTSCVVVSVENPGANAPRSFCEECFSPLEISYDYAALKSIASKTNWRLAASTCGATRNFCRCRKASSFRMQWAGLRWSPRSILQRNGDCGIFTSRTTRFASLPFHSRTRRGDGARGRAPIRIQTVGCSSTGNLANAVAAQAAQQGFDACVFIPADLEPAKILNTAVYGRAYRSHRRKLRSREPAVRTNRGPVSMGTRERELAPYYSEGSKTHGFEIAEQLGWRLPDNVVVAHGRRFSNYQDRQSISRTGGVGWVEEKPVKFFVPRPPAALDCKRGKARTCEI